MSVDDLDKNEDLPIHSSGSADPRIQSSQSDDPPVNSTRSVVSTGRRSSAAAKQDVMSYLEKVNVDTRLEDIDQVYISCTQLTSVVN